MQQWVRRHPSLLVPQDMRTTYQHAKYQFKQLLRTSKGQAWHTFTQEVHQSEPAHVWTQLQKAKTSCSLFYPSKLSTPTRQILRQPQDIAAYVLQHFCLSLTTDEARRLQPTSEVIASSYVPLYLDFLPISSELLTRITKLKPQAVPGPDGIPTLFIKRCHITLSPHLLHLFNCSHLNEYVPTYWRLGALFPIHKRSGAFSGDPINLRPICLLNSLAKLLEAVISSRLMTHCATYSILAPNQFGFRCLREQTVHCNM